MPKVKDPVCGMMCDPETSLWKTDFEGQTYHFCSRYCLDQFEVDPERYIKALASSGGTPGNSGADKMR